MTAYEFINSVIEFDKHGDIKKLFTEKYCYGFALMMKQQFKDGIIFWDKWRNHAIIKIDDIYYDINGQYEPMNYSKFEELTVVIYEGKRL